MASTRAKRQKEVHFKVMRLLQDHPSISTREIARQVGISNGGAHYCVTALIEKGLVKLSKFTKSSNKRRYLYELTPRGVALKAALTVQFLARKKDEYNYLKTEIEQLETELGLYEKSLLSSRKG